MLRRCVVVEVHFGKRMPHPGLYFIILGEPYNPYYLDPDKGIIDTDGYDYDPGTRYFERKLWRYATTDEVEFYLREYVVVGGVPCFPALKQAAESDVLGDAL